MTFLPWLFGVRETPVTATRFLLRNSLAASVMLCIGPLLSPDGDDDQERAAGHEDHPCDHQPEGDPRQGGNLGSQVRSDVDPGVPVCVHHDDGPLAAGRIPDEVPRALAGTRGDPEVLLPGRRYRVSAGDVLHVVRPEV